MSGQIKIQNKKYKKTKHDHINILVKTQCNLTYTITYNDPRRFGFIDLLKKKDIHKLFLLNKLGKENGYYDIENGDLNNFSLLGSFFKTFDLQKRENN